MDRITAAEATALANAASKTAEELLANLRRTVSQNAKLGRRTISVGGLDLYSAEVIASVINTLQTDGFKVERIQDAIKLTWN